MLCHGPRGYGYKHDVRDRLQGTNYEVNTRLEKSTGNNKESLRAEMKSNQAEFKKAMSEMQSKLDTLTARVHDTKEQISDLEDKLI